MKAWLLSICLKICCKIISWVLWILWFWIVISKGEHFVPNPNLVCNSEPIHFRVKLRQKVFWMYIKVTARRSPISLYKYWNFPNFDMFVNFWPNLDIPLPKEIGIKGLNVAFDKRQPFRTWFMQECKIHCDFFEWKTGQSFKRHAIHS